MLVRVLVNPRARRRAVEERSGELVVWVRSPPSRGRANEEARRLLAEYFGVSQERVRLVRGQRSRLEVFELDQPEGASERRGG